MQLVTILKIESEVQRFKEKLAAAKKRISEKDYHAYSGSKEVAALKRAALDLKNELTNLNKTHYDQSL